MNIQPMIDELLLIRRGLGGVGYNQGTFGTRASHPCGTVCCMAGIAMFKQIGNKYLYAEADDVASEGAKFLGIRQNPEQNYPIFSTGSEWPDLISSELYRAGRSEQGRIDAAICALRVMNSKGGFGRVSQKRQREVIAQRLAEVKKEEQELSELRQLLKEVELEVQKGSKSAEPARLLRKDSHEPKKLPSRTGRKQLAVKD